MHSLRALQVCIAQTFVPQSETAAFRPAVRHDSFLRNDIDSIPQLTVVPIGLNGSKASLRVPQILKPDEVLAAHKEMAAKYGNLMSLL